MLSLGIGGALFAHVEMTILRWANGDLRDAQVGPTGRLGLALVLRGISVAAAAERLEAEIRREQQALQALAVQPTPPQDESLS